MTDELDDARLDEGAEDHETRLRVDQRVMGAGDLLTAVMAVGLGESRVVEGTFDKIRKGRRRAHNLL